MPVENRAMSMDKDLPDSLTVRDNAGEAGVYDEYDRLTPRSLFEDGIPATSDPNAPPVGSQPGTFGVNGVLALGRGAPPSALEFSH